MTYIEYFKLQAHNLFKDYQTKTSYIDEVDKNSYYQYAPKFFDIDSIFMDFDVEEASFNLIEAQQLIALMVGFETWDDLLEASESELELAKLLFDNQDKVYLEDWEMYVSEVESDLGTMVIESRLELFKQTYIKEHRVDLPDFRLNKNSNQSQCKAAEYIEYFKVQAKKLTNDYKTQTLSSVANKNFSYAYAPKYFDINMLIKKFGIDEQNFGLMKAQHLIAHMLGFKRWDALLKATEPELELAKLRYDYQNIKRLDNWEIYIASLESDYGLVLDAKGRLELFKEDLRNIMEPQSQFPDYRLSIKEKE